jgi:NAD(P)-dependent dehydrogenase (short-subunit alcohol dehydrogenase family)
MIERRSGRIINVGGAAAWAPARTDTAYSASKAAVYRLGETLAKQLAAHGIAVFTISPGLVRTAMTEGHYPANAPWADPDKAVELVKVLASGAADVLSGRCFHAERDDIGSLIAHSQQTSTRTPTSCGFARRGRISMSTDRLFIDAANGYTLNFAAVVRS